MTETASPFFKHSSDVKGYEVVTAGNGPDALGKVATMAPDLEANERGTLESLGVVSILSKGPGVAAKTAKALEQAARCQVGTQAEEREVAV